MITINNLGPIKSGDIHLNNLSIFIGESGAGKTYASYTIYSMFEHLKNTHENFEFFNKNMIDTLLTEHHLSINSKEIKEEIITIAESTFHKNQQTILSSTFNVPNSFFEDAKIKYSYNDFPDIKLYLNSVMLRLFIETHIIDHDNEFYKIKVSIDKNSVTFDLINIEINTEEIPNRVLNSKKLKNMLNNWFRRLTRFTNLVYIPAERVGLHVFKDELNKSRLEEYSDLSMSLNNNVNVDDLDIATYPKPISSYLNNLNNWIYRDTRVSTNKNTKKKKKKINTVDLLNGVPSAYEEFVSIRNRFKNFAVILYI